MSVWDVPCYNLDPIRRSVRNLSHKDLVSFPRALHGIANFTATKSDRTNPAYSGQNLMELFKRDNHAWRAFVRQQRGGSGRIPTPDPVFRDAITAINPDHAGLKAVYWAYTQFWRGRWNFRDEYDSAEFKDFFTKSWTLASGPSRINASAWNNAGKELQSAFSERWAYLDQGAIFVAHLWVIDGTRSYRTHKANYKRKGKPYPYIKPGGTNSDLEIIKFKGGYILNDTRLKESAILFWKDHQRLIQMLTASSKCYMYFGNYESGNTALNGRMVKAFEEVMNIMTQAMVHRSWDECNMICRAMDVAQFRYLASLAVDITTRSVKDQEDKIDKENLRGILDMDGIRSAIEQRGFGVRECMELYKVYKLLPCSDFCPFGVIDSFADKNDTVNGWHLDEEITTSFGDSFTITTEDFRTYMKRNMIMTYYSRHGTYPGSLVDDDNIPANLLSYPNVPESAITLDSVRFINIRGSFQYRMFDEMEHELVKDKKTAKKEPKGEESWYSDNQVLQYLFDPSFISQSKARKRYETRSYRHPRIIDVALKPEAKKPAQKVRAFYMAQDPDRRVLSEFEDNVARYITHKAGSSQGKSDMELSEKMFEITNWEEPDCQPCLISFDIAAFSPRQNPNFKKEGLKLWAEAFDMPWIENLYDLFSNVEMVWDKLGVKGSYNLKGNDLEGFNGRMNTGLHIDIMGMAVKICKQLGLITVGGRFACLIDDGALCLQVEVAQFRENVEKIMEVIEKVYWAFGLEISWDKTFVSTFFLQYLNRIFIDGYEVTPGLKAFLRIGKPVDVPAPTLFSDLDNISASVRGAITAGTDHRMAYAGYLVDVHHCIKKWSRYHEDFKFSDTLVALLPVPRSLGGLGLSSVFSLSTNETFSAMEAGLSAMRFLSWEDPNLQKFYQKLLENEVEEMSITGILKAPRSVRLGVKQLNEQRMARAAVTVVKAKAVNPFIKSVTALSKAGASSLCCEIVSGTDVMSEFTRERLWSMDPNNVIESIVNKLQTSTTAAKIIGYRKMVGITLANRGEAFQYLMDMKKGVRVSRGFALR